MRKKQNIATVGNPTLTKTVTIQNVAPAISKMYITVTAKGNYGLPEAQTVSAWALPVSEEAQAASARALPVSEKAQAASAWALPVSAEAQTASEWALAVSEEAHSEFPRGNSLKTAF